MPRLVVNPYFGAFHPLKVIFSEWQKIIKDLGKPGPLSQKFKYLFKAPGWSHDGSSKTSEELRKTLK